MVFSRKEKDKDDVISEFRPGYTYLVPRTAHDQT